VPKIQWLHYAENSLAPLCRKPTGLITPRDDTSRVRGSGQGFTYNFGRGMSAFSTPLVGYLSNTVTLGKGIGIVAVSGFAVVILMVLLLPETRGKVLVAYD